MAKSKILVTSATGNVGTPLSTALYNLDVPFTAATRNGNAAAERLGFRPETVYLDFRDPTGFADALQDCEILFLCGPSATPGAEKLLEPLVDEAVKQNIKHVVFIASYPGIRKKIEESGMDYTFLRGNFFMQNFELYQTRDIRDFDQIFMPCGEGKAPFIHTRDIGEVAAKAILNPSDFRNEEIYLTGPVALDHFEAAEIFSEVLGRKISYRNPDDETYTKVMKERGYSDEYIKAMIAVFGKIKKGQVAQTSGSVMEILGRTPATLSEYAEEKKDFFTKS